TRIAADLEDRAAHFVHRLQLSLELLGVGNHGAEFVHREGLAIEPRALLAKEDRSGRSELYHQRYERQWEREEDEEKQGADIVHHQLGHACPRRLRRGAKHHDRPAKIVVKTGARNLCLEKVRHKPGLNSLQLARMEDLFDLLEIRVAAA